MSSHPWKFFRAGGFAQVKLTSGADLQHLDQLDQKLWVALACPTTGLEFDAQTLALIDSDKDGRIRAPELIAAVKWTCSILRTPDSLIDAPERLPLAAINEAHPEGKAVLASAQRILTQLGRADANTIGTDDTADTARIFAKTVFNGDGVVVPESTEDAAIRAAIADIIACVGSVPDRSGKPGVNADLVARFVAEATAFSTWIGKSESDAATLLPLGAATEAAVLATRAVKAKIDDYFGRCRLAAFDPRAMGALNRDEKDFATVATKDLQINASEVAGFPLAQIAPGKPLPLDASVNPAWAAAISTFRNAAVTPLLGERSTLSESEWTALLGRLGAFECWSAGKAGAAVEKLGVERVRAWLASNAQPSILALIAQDKALETEFNAIATLDKLIRFHRNLHRLATNFVNFKDLYGGSTHAIFQVGTLYLDQRACSLCLSVDDAGRHASMASLAGAYLAYVDCVRKSTGEKRSVVAIFSQGDDENLMVGRNGIFYDRKGRDFDATITRIVANPISLRQAFWAPYKKFVRLIEEQIAKRAAAADAAANSKLAAAAEAAANADKNAGKPDDKKPVDVGTVAAMGVAFGAIAGFFTSVASGFLTVAKGGPWSIVGALIAIIALISGPSVILAYIKLRKRNLGPILDANGWALNSAARINVPFGASLTAIAQLPPGSSVDYHDSFAEKALPWKRWGALALLAYLSWGYYQGDFDRHLPNGVRSTHLLGSLSPKYVAPITLPAPEKPADPAAPTPPR
jgi:hypothetical protein